MGLKTRRRDKKLSFLLFVVRLWALFVRCVVSSLFIVIILRVTRGSLFVKIWNKWQLRSDKKNYFTSELLIFRHFAFYEIFDIIICRLGTFLENYESFGYLAEPFVWNTNHSCLHNVWMSFYQSFQFGWWYLMHDFEEMK